jgi:hypothetical protein
VTRAVGRVRELANEIGCFFDRNPDGTLHLGTGGPPGLLRTAGVLWSGLGLGKTVMVGDWLRRREAAPGAGGTCPSSSASSGFSVGPHQVNDVRSEIFLLQSHFPGGSAKPCWRLSVARDRRAGVQRWWVTQHCKICRRCRKTAARTGDECIGVGYAFKGVTKGPRPANCELAPLVAQTAVCSIKQGAAWGWRLAAFWLSIRGGTYGAISTHVAWRASQHR